TLPPSLYYLSCFFFFSLILRQPSSTLFPYTTLFRSVTPGRAKSKRASPLFESATFVASTAPCNGKPRSSSTTWMRRAMCSGASRSEEHTSELQSRGHLVCRLLLEKKKKYRNTK